ncbi:hypothetical protein N9224_00610 [Akkermansiaceae bacterium]|nr:hypothetical protein [Akkermansiaceae bacterium]MDB4500666.1 hypothetical protein [Akkermansiaceae bacterium]
MASIKVTKASSVKSIKRQFKEDTGLTLRIYNGVKFADEKTKIVEIAKTDDPTGNLEIHGRTLVGNVEKFFKESFGIRVQIANGKDTGLMDNKLSLAKAKKA